MAFICKSHVNFVDNPQNPHITMPDGAVWDVESWMQSLSDDPEIVMLLWQVIGAVIRPNVPWNKSVWLYSEAGNNGKATLCELMRNLCGSGAYTSISLAQFGAQFTGCNCFGHKDEESTARNNRWSDNCRYIGICRNVRRSCGIFIISKKLTNA